MPPNTISRVPLLKINLHSQFVKEKKYLPKSKNHTSYYTKTNATK